MENLYEKVFSHQISKLYIELLLNYGEVLQKHLKLN